MGVGGRPSAEAFIEQWWVAEGDHVHAGQVLARANLLHTLVECRPHTPACSRRSSWPQARDLLPGRCWRAWPGPERPSHREFPARGPAASKPSYMSVGFDPPHLRRRPMKFRTRLAAISAIALACALGLGAAAQAQTAMKISISVAQNSHQGVGIDTFASEVEKRTGGRYKIQTFYSGSLGGERESIEAVQLGTQELTLHLDRPGAQLRARGAHPRHPLPVPRQGACARRARRPHRPGHAQGVRVQGLQGPGLGRERRAPHDQQQARRQRARRPEGPEDAHDGEPGARGRLQGLRHHHHADGLPGGVHRAAAGHGRRPGEPAVGDHGGQVRPGAEAPHAHRPRLQPRRSS